MKARQSVDQRLRTSERRAAEEGTPEAEQALLRLRVQLGDLSGDWLKVAATLGHPPARALLGFVRVATFDDLLETVDAWGPTGQLRVFVALLGLDPALIADRTQLRIEAKRRFREWRMSVRESFTTTLSLLFADQRGGEAFKEVLLLYLRKLGSRPAGEVVRRALVPWALSGLGQPPLSLVPEVALPRDVRQEQRQETAQDAFAASLETKQIKTRATALRKRRRAKTLSLEHVRLAAWLGDPAAWLVAKPEGEPELEAKETRGDGAGFALSVQLSEQIMRFAKKLPKDERRRLLFLRRLHDPDASAASLGPAWPDWSRPLVAALALAVGDALVERFEASVAEEPRPRAALAAAHAFDRDPRGDPQSVQEAWKAASNCGRRKLPAPEKAAAQGAAWAAQLVFRIYTSAQVPVLSYARVDLLQRALDAGFSPQELWDLLRARAIAWALNEEPDGEIEARAYRPGESYRVGDRVSHPTFGAGRVTGSHPKRVEIAFEDGSTKSLIQNL